LIAVRLGTVRGWAGMPGVFIDIKSKIVKKYLPLSLLYDIIKMEVKTDAVKINQR